MTQAGAARVPQTPLLRYFRETLCKRPRGRDWGEFRISEAQRLLARPERLARLFEDSVTIVQREYRNYQPFYPKEHRFGFRGKTGVRHGDELRYTVDVAARLARRDLWTVNGDSNLDFHYIDRELPLARARPRPVQDPGSLLEVDLFLANARDGMPILAEVKIGTDECPFYALIQLLTQAAFAVTPSQRERLVLFGSRPDFVLREAVGALPAKTDLYVVLVNPPAKEPYRELRSIAIELGRKLIKQPRIAARIRRIAWLRAEGTSAGELAVERILA